MNVLGLRRDTASPPPGLEGGSIDFLDLTVDGHTLDHFFVHHGEVTALGGGFDEEFGRTNVRRLLGDDVPMPSFELRWAVTPRRLWGITLRHGIPYAASESVFADGRVCLHYCSCGDLDCGVLSTRLEVTEKTVTWHDTWWQWGYKPFEPGADARPRTFTFDRAQYESVLRPLLDAPWNAGGPQLG